MAVSSHRLLERLKQLALFLRRDADALVRDDEPHPLLLPLERDVDGQAVTVLDGVGQ
jgi:hypothetical protein